MDNANIQEYLDKIRNKVVENLKRTTFAPLFGSQDRCTTASYLEWHGGEADGFLDDLDENENKDMRATQRRLNKHTWKTGELNDSED